MVDSVPELVKRTRSTWGNMAQIFSASTLSFTQGAPYDSPLAAAACTAAITSGWA